MPLIHWRPQDEDSPPSLGAAFATGDDPGWWSSLQQYGLVAALAVASAISFAPAAQAAAVQHQDDPAGNLAATVDEYFWQNPVKPYAELAIWPEQGSFDEQIPAGNLTATVDEYLWQNPSPPLYFPAPQLFIFDEVIVPQPAPFQPDEDFWVNPVPPYAALSIYPQQWTYDDQVIVPARQQNYIGVAGARNYVVQDIGGGIEF